MQSHVMTTQQLDKVLGEFPARMVERTATSVAVKGKRHSDGQVVVMLSAVNPVAGHWHVMAVEGLLSATAEKCRWFLKCTRPATTIVNHPTLGDVPCCAQCAALATQE